MLYRIEAERCRRQAAQHHANDPAVQRLIARADECDRAARIAIDISKIDAVLPRGRPDRPSTLH